MKRSASRGRISIAVPCEASYLTRQATLLYTHELEGSRMSKHNFWPTRSVFRRMVAIVATLALASCGTTDGKGAPSST